jgi:hypothetical protein
MRSTSENNGIWNSAEVQGRRSRPSASGVTVNARDFTARHPSASGHPVLTIGRCKTLQEYSFLKETAQTASPGFLNRTTDQSEHQQADTQSIRTAAIFSTPRLPSDFAGLNQAGRSPADCSVAAGPSHLLMTTGITWAVLDKAGHQLLCTDLAAWFSSVSDDAIIGNSRVIYDQFCGRWMIAACGRSSDGKSSRLLFSVSQTRNPLGAWWNWALDAGLNGVEETSLVAEGLGFGLDNSALYLTANMFDESGEFQYAKLRILNKSALLAGEALQWWDYWDLRDPDGSAAFGIQPAHTFGTPGIAYLLNATSEGQSLIQWRLTQPLSESPRLSRRAIPTVGYQLAPNACQPESRIEIETGDTRLINVVFRNGLLWTAHTVAANWGEANNVAAIQWFQINTGAGIMSQQHIYGHPSAYYFCPTIMVDGRGNMMMVFNRAGKTEYPAARFTGRLSTDQPGTLHSSVPLKESTVSCHSEWGSYNGAAVDTNDTRIWVIGQYAANESAGATWIGETSYMAGNAESSRGVSNPVFA